MGHAGLISSTVTPGLVARPGVLLGGCNIGLHAGVEGLVFRVLGLIRV